MKTSWVLRQEPPDERDYKEIAKELSVSPVTVRCMCNRGLTSVGDMEKYLEASLKDLYDPFLMKGVREAVDLLLSYKKGASAGAGGTGETSGEEGRTAFLPLIAIASDYDCDGICSAKILELGLEHMGFETVIFTPDRVSEGYGLNRRIVDDAHKAGAGMIITCDNGIAAVDAVTYAKSLDIMVIVTDHHEPQEELPPADVIVDPKQEGETYPFNKLCGAGVAYKLIGALCPGYETELLEYAGIATVTDVMELVDENRILVKQGLLRLENTKHIGLRALVKALRLDGQRIKASDIGFRVGPTLNASGRIASVREAFALLASTDASEADKRAGKLCSLNDERKAMTDKATLRAIDLLIQRFPDIDAGECDDVLVIYVPDVHESIIGLVAGKIKERFNHPAIAFTDAASGDDGEERIKGSGRSIKGYHMFDKLLKCKDLMVAFGGHEMAAGLTIAKSKLDELTSRLNSESGLSEEDFILKLNIDVPTPISYVTEDLITELEQMAPFGVANPRPLFAEKNLLIKNVRYLGNERRHLKLTVADDKGCVREAMAFSRADEFDEYIIGSYGEKELEAVRCGVSAKRLALAYRPEINVWNDQRNIQLMIEQWM